eukprot:CAMPEP_0202448170 /NCGR_PEP_ID=MMETSP1360-20130828/6979_1 /ASSEMBLY_ACC=CAM_ASM_000848 /TAXON_ID=515479 /ORGANISM="Licmophora paradoxa, Strain CCMP2313" /LENGTH=195 /DNA_ID=CAMNT_0049065611 /DNA_START=964 /DNA_END=1551 /DNA_ORIENTATION=+
MSNDSIWHVIDRFLAAPALLLEFGRWATMLFAPPYKDGTPQVSNTVCALYFIALLLAVYFYSQSQRAQQQLDRDGFVVWHTLWHCYPILASAIMLVDYYSKPKTKRNNPNKLLNTTTLHWFLNTNTNNKNSNVGGTIRTSNRMSTSSLTGTFSIVSKNNDMGNHNNNNNNNNNNNTHDGTYQHKHNHKRNHTKSL